MAARTKARKRALDVLFESELRGLPLGETLADRVAAGDPPINPYTVQLVDGIREHQEDIDNLLSTYSVGWPMDRMPAVDRNLLRIAAYELMYEPDVPDPVAVSEAVNIAAELSTDESPGFVSGLLSKLIEVKTADAR